MPNNIHDLIRGLYYYSEFEYPVKKIEMTAEDTKNHEVFLCKKYEARSDQIKEISTEAFFKPFYYFVDPQDKITRQNAKQFITLQKFLLKNFENIRIFRVEKSTTIPIIIIATRTNENILALETFSEET